MKLVRIAGVVLLFFASGIALSAQQPVEAPLKPAVRTPDPAPLAEPLSPGSSGQFAVAAPGDAVSLALETADAGRVIVSTSGSSDTVLSVFDDSGNLMAWNDDYGEGLTSQVVADLDAGMTYALVVTLYSPSSVGSFGITVSPLIDTSIDDFGGRDDPGTHRPGSTTAARLDFIGDTDAFTFTPEHSGVYRIETVGMLDTVMSVIDERGYVMFEADDTGKNLNPAIETGFRAGERYTVLVQGYSQDYTGAYELTSEAIADAPPLRPSTVRHEGEVYALIVGAADYQGSGDLVGTLTDSYNMYRYVRDVLGAPEENISLLQDQLGVFDDTISDSMVQDALSDIAQRARPEDTVFFYYSGHGDERNGVFSLSLPDGELTGEDLVSTITEIESDTVILIFDSCNAGGLGKLLVDERRTVLSASAGDELSYVYEAGASARTLGSVFTSWFTDHLLYSEEALSLEEAFDRTVQDLHRVQATQNPQLFTMQADFRVR
ncbi:MAG: caspase family protein [Spirochaetaceae bacterium]